MGISSWSPQARRDMQTWLWGFALGAHKPGKICKHGCNIPPYSLKVLIPIYFWHFWASKWPPSWAPVGQSWVPFWAQASRIRFGLGLGTHKPGKICQHSCQSEGGSPERLIPSLGVETGLGGRIFVLLLLFLLLAGPWPCLNNRHAAGTRRPTLTP